MPDQSGVEDPGIGRRVATGARWSLLNNVALRLGIFVSGIVLARILSPADYGVFAIALVVLTLVQSMNELGVSLALVRWPGDVRRFAPTVMTVASSTSVLFYLACYVAADPLARAFDSPESATVIRVLCLCVIVDGLATTPSGILNREFLQHRRFVCDLLGFIVSTSLTIGLAAAGWGAMSFAVGRLAANVVMLVALNVATPIRVLPGWDRTVIGPLLRFGLPLAGSSLLVLSVANVDNLVVGAVLDPVALGLYLMAFNLSSWPLTVFSEAARRVSLAGFSRLVHDPEGLRRAFGRGLWLLMAAAIPVCVGLIVYAVPMLRFLYGEQWVPSAVALRWLAVLGLIRIALFVAYDCLVALGRPRRLIGLQALWLVLLLPALVAGARLDGIRGAAIAHVLVAGLVVAPSFLVSLSRVGIGPAAVFRGAGRPLLGGLVAAATAWPVLRLVDGSFAQLAIGGPLLVGVYLAIVWPMRELLPGTRIGRHRAAPRRSGQASRSPDASRTPTTAGSAPSG